MGKRESMPETGGRPRKAVSERLTEGNRGYKPIKIIPAPSTYEGVEVPEPSKYIKAKQKNGELLYAEEIYNNTWGWLVEKYVMSFARWIQCEEAISEYGFLAKHSTTGQAITSPYVSMSQSYMKQTTKQ